MHPGHDLLEYFLKCSPLCFVIAFDCRRVLETPVCGGRMTRPDRTGFSCGIVANGDDEIHVRRAGSGEFVPRFAAQILDRVAGFHDLLDRERIDFAARLAAGAIADEAAFAQGGDQGFGHDGTGGVAGAQKQYVAGFVSHVVFSLSSRKNFYLVNRPARSRRLSLRSWAWPMECSRPLLTLFCRAPRTPEWYRASGKSPRECRTDHWPNICPIWRSSRRRLLPFQYPDPRQPDATAFQQALAPIRPGCPGGSGPLRRRAAKWRS